VVRIVSGARQRGALPCAFSMVHGKKKAFGKKKKFVVRYSFTA
jgi:hypothetical protein